MAHNISAYWEYSYLNVNFSALLVRLISSFDQVYELHPAHNRLTDAIVILNAS